MLRSFLVCLWILVCRENSIEAFDESTIEWKRYSIFNCSEPVDTSVSLLECFPSDEIYELIEKSCLDEQHWNFDQDTCPMPTSVTPISTTPDGEFPGTRTTPGLFECEDTNYIGEYCNITSSSCEMAKPCQNNGTCIEEGDSSHEYICRCLEKYSGDHCQHDHRVCKSNTCWHDGKCVEMHETISMDDQTIFQCHCSPGYNGDHCELISNMCENITCENGGICRSSYLAWKCQCLGESLYSGEYCQDKSSALVARQILGKSFAFIAILAIVGLFVFVITMDVLKFVFNIDPVDRERKWIEQNQQRKRKKWANSSKKKNTPPLFALRFFYIP